MSGALAQSYHGWDSRAKQRLGKSGLKVTKKGGETRAKDGCTASNNNNSNNVFLPAEVSLH